VNFICYFSLAFSNSKTRNFFTQRDHYHKTRTTATVAQNNKTKQNKTKQNKGKNMNAIRFLYFFIATIVAVAKSSADADDVSLLVRNKKYQYKCVL